MRTIVPNASDPEQKPLLRLARYRLIFECIDTVRMSTFTGAAWRGAFGHALKDMTCNHEKICDSCISSGTCMYHFIFESAMPEKSKLWPLKTAPHPFIFEVPPLGLQQSHPPGALINLGLTLFGNGNRFLPIMIHAIANAAKKGIGSGRGRLALRQVEWNSEPGCDEWIPIYRPGWQLAIPPEKTPDIPDIPDVVDLQLITPLNLKRDGCPVTHKNFAFHDLFRTNLRRCSLLEHLYESENQDLDHKALSLASREIPILSSDLTKQSWVRHSTRQKCKSKTYGVVGRIQLCGDLIKPFWPWLWLGQYTLTGKCTAMGMGKYQITNVKVPSPQLMTTEVAS